MAGRNVGRAAGATEEEHALFARRWVSNTQPELPPSYARASGHAGHQLIAVFSRTSFALGDFRSSPIPTDRVPHTFRPARNPLGDFNLPGVTANLFGYLRSHIPTLILLDRSRGHEGSNQSCRLISADLTEYDRMRAAITCQASTDPQDFQQSSQYLGLR